MILRSLYARPTCSGCSGRGSGRSVPITLVLVLILLLQIVLAIDAALSMTPSRSSSSRRRFLTSAVLLGLPETASAVAPITQQEADTGLARAVRWLRPKPPKILRQKLNMDFAVLLMRSSYAATDELNVIAMQQFQRDFFLIRSSEYEPYIQQLGPGFVQQGDLTDPAYFDFISFAQYLTINRAIADPANIFEEQQPILEQSAKAAASNDNDSSAPTPQKFETVVVRRTIPNDQLVDEHDQRVGTAILQFLEDRYGGTDIRLLKSEPPLGEDQIQAALTQLVKLFVINGFAWEGNVERMQQKQKQTSTAGGVAVTFCLTLQSPATLWGAQSLRVSRAPLRNDFLRKTARQLVARRMGGRVTASSVQWEGNDERTYLTIHI